MKEDEIEVDLLIDLLKIYKKYGVPTINKLVNSLVAGNLPSPLLEFLNRESVLLDEFIAISKSFTNPPSDIKRTLNKNGQAHVKGKNANQVSKLIIEIKQSDPELSGVLNQVYTKLKSGELLPTMADVRSFAIRKQILDKIGKDRKSSIKPLMVYLIKSNLTILDINSAVEEMIKCA